MYIQTQSSNICQHLEAVKHFNKLTLYIDYLFKSNHKRVPPISHYLLFPLNQFGPEIFLHAHPPVQYMCTVSSVLVPPPRQPSGTVLASSAGGPGFNPQSRTASYQRRYKNGTSSSLEKREKGNTGSFSRIKIGQNVMDKIWYRKSFEVGGHWPLWRR